MFSKAEINQQIRGPEVAPDIGGNDSHIPRLLERLAEIAGIEAMQHELGRQVPLPPIVHIQPVRHPREHDRGSFVRLRNMI